MPGAGPEGSCAMVAGMDTAIDIAAIRDAAERIAPHLHRSPLVTSRFFDAQTGARVHFKCECFQKTGSFKARGAYNAVFGLSDELAARGVCAASSGNHGQALAAAAAERGIRATVVMPENASPVKREATVEYGAQIVSCGPGDAARKARLAEFEAADGAHCVGSHDDPRIIAGQGTAALEILEELPDVDAILVPLGGGGLLSGTLITAGALSPKTRVYGCEPRGADDGARSLAAGRLLPQEGARTIADGLRTSVGPRHCWPVIREAVEDILLVEEEEILSAMRSFWMRCKILIEPSSAVAVAALLRGDFRGQRVALVLSGGNFSPPV